MTFKTAVDNISDYFNLHNLYYRSLSEKSKEVFLLKLRSAYEEFKGDPKNSHSRPIKILSDIDDTFLSSGGSFGNVDSRYPKEVLYPAVTTFLKELDLGCNSEEGVWDQGRHGNLAFLSARPHVEATKQPELMTYDKFAMIFESGKLHTFPTLLLGNFKGLTGAINKNFQEMVRKKFKNFEQYLMLYPEYDFVFIGDNGQGDAAVGEKMIKEYPQRMRAVFIHKVLENEKKTYGYSDSPDWKKMLWFTNYVEAAILAFKYKLIHFKGVQRILTAAHKEFDIIRWQNDSQKKKASDSFEKSCSEAHHLVVRETKSYVLKKKNGFRRFH